MPWLPATYHPKMKLVFFVYHLPWCLLVTVCAAQQGSDWSAWIDLPVMYGFTLFGAIAPSKAVGATAIAPSKEGGEPGVDPW